LSAAGKDGDLDPVITLNGSRVRVIRLARDTLLHL